MIRMLTIAVMSVAVLPLAGCAGAGAVRALRAEDESLADLAWLSGAWVSEGEPGSGMRTEEHWTTPAAGSMLGVNRTIAGDRLVFYEFLRIEATGDGIVYLASPKGRTPPTPFRLVESTAKRLTFENPAHDFPQRIIYERREGRLHARVEGQREGVVHGEDWWYLPARIERP